MPRSSATLTVICYTRPTSSGAPTDATSAMLQQCAAEGEIALIERTWPAECSLTDLPPNSDALSTFERFRSWADHAGVSICPPFEQVTRISRITGEHQELLRTPCLCLALYVNEQLVAVYPHRDGEVTHSVADVIKTLRAGEWPARVATTTPPEPPPIGRCPECGAPCQSGQGVYACLDCRWVAATTATGRYRDCPTLRAHWETTTAQP